MTTKATTEVAKPTKAPAAPEAPKKITTLNELLAARKKGAKQ